MAVMHRTLPRGSPRIERIRDTLLAESCSICLERPALLRAFERSEAGKRAAKNEHPMVRRAMALRYLLQQRVPRIYDDELIVGNMSSRRIGANYYPEGASINVLEDIFRLEHKQVPLMLSARDKRRLLGLALWGSTKSIAARALLRPGRFKYLLGLFRPVRYMMTEVAGISHAAGGYDIVVHKGLRYVDERAAHCLATGQLEDGTLADADQLAFLRSVRIVIEGIRAMAANLAEACEARAAGVSGGNSADISATRRAELLRAAEACRRVPYEPAQSLLEGLQACWLVHVALNLEDYEQGLSFGRLDQILAPLYDRDIESGNLGREEATELIASFQLKTCETIPLYSERVDLGFSGNTVGQAITLGGVDAAGEDATNELSGLFLDAFAEIRTREPNIQVRVHEGTPQWFLDKAAEVVQLGCGSPAFFGDAVIVKALEAVGFTREHARDYAIIGCVELTSPGRTCNSSDAALCNLGMCLELALNQGRRFGSAGVARRLGAATRSVDEMRSFDDVVDAFRAQVDDMIDELARVNGWLEQSYRAHRTTPIGSAITEGCIESAKDLTWGGARYDMTSIQAVGVADVGDSLYALKHLVFDERALSLREFVDILERDFEDHEPLRVRLCRRLPRYGNGLPEVDRYTALAADIFADAVTAQRNTRGGRWVPGFYSMTCGTSFGKVTGALPNGRHAGARLSNGFSPVDGVDRAGPTALMRSAASLGCQRWANGGALNVKFDARTVSGRAGRDALASLVRTYLVDEQGMEVQINVLDADTLRAARADPQAYPGLMVRVSGYCAYFNDLQPEVKDEIIERTAHGAGY